MKEITSVSNPQVKAWKKLATKKGRQQSQTYLLDGWHLVKEALNSDEPIQKILVTPSFKYLADLEILPEIQYFSISVSIAKHLSETKSPQGIFAEVAFDQTTISPTTASGAWLLLDGVQDPGNIGTMVRTADAAGFSGVVFGPKTADMYQPKVVRSMQGSQFHLQLVTADLSTWIQAFKAKNYPVFGSELNKDARSYQEVGQHQNFALIMGNEGNGMSAELLQQTSLNLYIPIKGHAESLNVAVAAGILMFQLID